MFIFKCNQEIYVILSSQTAKIYGVPKYSIYVFVIKGKMRYPEMLVVSYQPSFPIVPSDCRRRISFNMTL